MNTNQMSPAEHISHAIRSLIEAAELTEGMLSDSGREHFASILFRVGEVRPRFSSLAFNQQAVASHVSDLPLSGE